MIFRISLPRCLKFWYFYLDDIKFISLIRENWLLYGIESSYLRVRGAFIFCQMFFCALLTDITHFSLTSFLVSLPFIIILHFKCGLFQYNFWLDVYLKAVDFSYIRFVLSCLTLSRLVEPAFHIPARVLSVHFFTSSSSLYCLMPAVLVGIRWVSGVGLVWVALVTDAVEHLCMG